MNICKQALVELIFKTHTAKLSVRDAAERIMKEFKKLEEEVKRLEDRDCSATIQLSYSSDIFPFNPFAIEDLKIVDIGVSDNCYIVESNLFAEMQRNNREMKDTIEELEGGVWTEKELSKAHVKTILEQKKRIEKLEKSIWDHLDNNIKD